MLILPLLCFWEVLDLIHIPLASSHVRSIYLSLSRHIALKMEVIRCIMEQFSLDKTHMYDIYVLAVKEEAPYH
jgi:hypothetical protein